MTGFPQLLHTVVDTPNVRALAEFYRQLLGLQYRPGHEINADGEDDVDWLILTDADGRRLLAFQYAETVKRTTWPEPDVPMQMHLDFTVPDRESLDEQHARAIGLGAEMISDQTDDPNEPLYVYADPTGHPFCIFIA